MKRNIIINTLVVVMILLTFSHVKGGVIYEGCQKKMCTPGIQDLIESLVKAHTQDDVLCKDMLEYSRWNSDPQDGLHCGNVCVLCKSMVQAVKLKLSSQNDLTAPSIREAANSKFLENINFPDSLPQEEAASHFTPNTGTDTNTYTNTDTDTSANIDTSPLNSNNNPYLPTSTTTANTSSPSSSLMENSKDSYPSNPETNNSMDQPQINTNSNTNTTDTLRTSDETMETKNEGEDTTFSVYPIVFILVFVGFILVIFIGGYVYGKLQTKVTIKNDKISRDEEKNSSYNIDYDSFRCIYGKGPNEISDNYYRQTESYY